MAVYLKNISLKPVGALPGAFPFSLDVIRELGRIEISSPVTLFVGENGSGKSTLMEGIAAAAASVVVGGQSLKNDPSLAHARSLGAALKCEWSKRTHKGFFLRAEDFFGYARRMRSEQEELGRMSEEFDEKYSGYGLMLAKGAVLGQRNAVEQRYGGDLDSRSHGESFLTLFRSRFVPGGLYILDEPEAPLSPQRQLALIAMIQEMVREGDSQFIIATHSPILMAIPDALILSFDTVPVEPVRYEDLEHVALMRDFLKDPGRFLRHL
jgi:predicted ATPase